LFTSQSTKSVAEGPNSGFEASPVFQSQSKEVTALSKR
jgi:hypothetical protein